MKSINLLLATLILSGPIISCTGTKQFGMMTSPDNSGSNYDQPYQEEESTIALVQIERKILSSALVTLQVEHTDTANNDIELIAQKYEGYTKSVGTYQTIIRVKSEQLEPALDDLSQLGKVQSQNITGQDVTDEYLDYRIRLENAEKARSRYLQLLENAETVEAALKVEKELERLNETIDLLKGKINRVNHLEAYSTITINLNQKTKPGFLGYIGYGLYKGVKWMFVRN